MTYRLGNETVFEHILFCILDTGIVSETEEGRTMMLDMTVMCWPGQIHQPKELSAVLKQVTCKSACLTKE